MYTIYRKIDDVEQVIGYADNMTEFAIIVDADRKANKDDATYSAKKTEDENDT